MAENEEQNVDPSEQGTYDTASFLYVLGGIPFMIAFFVGLFLLVGYCDGAATYIPA